MDWSKDQVNSREKTQYLNDKVDTLDLESGADFKAVRMIGPSRMIAVHTFKIIGSKTGKEHRIPKQCLAFDSVTQQMEGPCPYCDIDPGTPRREVLTNVIDRDLQEDKPETPKKPNEKELEVVEMYGYKCRLKRDKKSKTWTPVRMWRITPSGGGKISDITSLNKRVNKKTGEKEVYQPQHPVYGFDLQVKYNKTKAPAEQYAVIKGDASKIDPDEEKKYLLWDLDVEQPEKLETAKKEAKELAKKLVNAKEAPDDDEDEDDEPKKGKKSAGKKSKKPAAEDEDWDEDEDLEDDEPKSKKKKKPADDDEDEDDDEGVPWDEDEDDEPKKKKKATAKKKRPADDDEDEDDDADDEDEEDDEPPARKKKKPEPAKKKRRPDPDEDEDEDEEDDEEDDEPPVKKKKRKPEPDDDEDDEDDEPPAKKKKRRPVEDDEDEPPAKKKKKRPDPDEDEDDEEDDEDEQPRRKSKKPAAGKKKKKSDDWDDDGDDWDD